MTNICKTASSLDQYYNSCPSSHLLKNVNSALLLGNLYSPGRNNHLTFIYLKTLLENTGFIDYIKHPQKMIEDGSRMPALKEKNTTKKELPKFFHGLWLTNKQHPKAVDTDLENFLAQAKKLEGYKTVVWTNIDPHILRKLTPKLEEKNITVNSIASIGTKYSKVLDFLLSPEKYIVHLRYLSGVKIDLAKYIIEESEGGVLADLNFVFHDDFKQNYLESYDFVALPQRSRLREFKENEYTEPGEDQFFVENSFFAAKPHHPIFKGILDFIEEMITSPDCPLQEFRKIIKGSEMINIFSMTPLTWSYMKYNNLDGNKDAIINGCSRGNYSLNTEKFQEHESMEINLNSASFRDISHYLASYSNLLYEIQQNSNCIEDPIGRDSFSATWHAADI